MNDTASAADGRLIERSFDLPFGYRATFIWLAPTSPSKFAGRLTYHASASRARSEKFLAAYQAARREFFEEVGAVLGGTILIADTDLKSVCGHEVIVPPTQH